MLIWIKKHPRLTVVFGAGAAFALFFLISLCIPVTSDLCSYNEHAQHDECPQYHLGPYILLSVLMAADTHNGFITAIATAFLTGITYMLVSLGKDQSRITRAELRAYVSATAGGIMMEPDGETIAALVEIKNAGQTPAFDIRIPARATLSPPFPQRFKIKEVSISDDEIRALTPITLPKDGSSVLALSIKISYADMVTLASDPSGRFYAFGLVIYKDVFGDPQWVEFCGYLEAKRFLPAVEAARKIIGQKIDISFKIAEFGNDTSFNPSRRGN